MKVGSSCDVVTEHGSVRPAPEVPKFHRVMRRSLPRQQVRKCKILCGVRNLGRLGQLRISNEFRSKSSQVFTSRLWQPSHPLANDDSSPFIHKYIYIYVYYTSDSKMSTAQGNIFLTTENLAFSLPLLLVCGTFVSSPMFWKLCIW